MRAVTVAKGHDPHARYLSEIAQILLTLAAMVAFGEWFSDWARRKIR